MKYIIDNGSDIKKFGTDPFYKVGSTFLYKGHKAVLTQVFYDSFLFEMGSRKVVKLEIDSDEYGLIEIDPIEIR